MQFRPDSTVLAQIEGERVKPDPFDHVSEMLLNRPVLVIVR
jgi:hypothetical protein